MKSATVEYLLYLNRQFYQTLAKEFSATRQRVQPGVRRVVADLPEKAHLLDLGCGNGALWRVLAERSRRGIYVGLDFSPELLDFAWQGVQRAEGRTGQPNEQAVRQNGTFGEGNAVFLPADLSAPHWEDVLQAHGLPAAYDRILAFAVFHHLPGRALRLQTLSKIHALLAPSGRFIHSEWQFLNNEKLRARIQPWEAAGLHQDDVDPGDYLLDWRHGKHGLRYVHFFEEAELAELAEETGFRVVETWRSDGEGGQLGLYQVWEPFA